MFSFLCGIVAGMQEVYIKWLRGDSLKKKTWVNNYLEFDQELVRKEYLSCVPELIMSVKQSRQVFKPAKKSACYNEFTISILH
jgi:hypothetical protein